jgi:hypothetical protein
VQKRFVINPFGEVDGLILEDGTLAKYPPHMGAELTSAIKPSDTVSVRGFRENAITIKALIVRCSQQKGWAHRTSTAAAIEAISIGATPQTLHPIYDRPIGRAP